MFCGYTGRSTIPPGSRAARCADPFRGPSGGGHVASSTSGPMVTSSPTPTASNVVARSRSWRTTCVTVTMLNITTTAGDQRERHAPTPRVPGNPRTGRGRSRDRAGTHRPPAARPSPTAPVPVSARPDSFLSAGFFLSADVFSVADLSTDFASPGCRFRPRRLPGRRRRRISGITACRGVEVVGGGRLNGSLGGLFAESLLLGRFADPGRTCLCRTRDGVDLSFSAGSPAASEASVFCSPSSVGSGGRRAPGR